MINAWTLIGFGANATMIVMLLGWTIARRLKNASYLEVAWSYGFAIIAGLYALIGTGDSLRKALIATMAIIWSVRLGTSLLLKVIRNHPAEEPRYVALRHQFPKRPWLMFFGFSQYQAAILAFLSAPFAIVCSNTDAGTNGWEIAGVVLWTLAVAAQLLANFQSSRFRSIPKNSGKVCDAGLWHYSRHPDLFFEWLVWVAYYLFSIGSPWGWVTVYCPLLMLYFVTKVTGIPPAEAECLNWFGEKYRDYQRTTSAFFPALPRRSDADEMSSRST
jgi:steroid 5-alpha reductase family enzyme